MPSRDDLAQCAALRVGAVLRDKWRLERLLGVGGMAAVYAASHRNGKRVAIKVLHAHLALDDQIRQRFLREGYVANSIGHPAVVGVDDDDVDDEGTPFLVMELLVGETLSKLRRRRGGRVDLEEALPLLAQLLDALSAAHGRGVVHRDIKPANVFLVAGAKLRVLDFGLARVRELQQHPNDLTRPDAVLGTPHYMAPEQAMGRWDLVGPQTDLWACGAVFHRLVTGRYVHDADSAQQALALAASSDVPSFAEAMPDAPACVSDFVDRALCYSITDRYEHAEAMLAALQRVGVSLGISLPARMPVTDTRARLQSRTDAPLDDESHLHALLARGASDANDPAVESGPGHPASRVLSGRLPTPHAPAPNRRASRARWTLWAVLCGALGLVLMWIAITRWAADCTSAEPARASAAGGLQLVGAPAPDSAPDSAALPDDREWNVR